MSVKVYTDRVDNFQIREITYIGEPPEGHELDFDIVKWVPYSEPRRILDITTGKYEWITEYSYSVARLRWDWHEEWYKFESVGMRWLEAHPSEEVVQMILDWANRIATIITKKEEYI